MSLINNTIQSVLTNLGSKIPTLTLLAASGLTYLRYRKLKGDYNRKLPIITANNESINELLNYQLNTTEYLSLLTKLISHTKELQNSYPTLIPQEELVANQLIEYLQPLTRSDTNPTGPLIVRKLTYAPGRSNLIVQYNPSNHSKYVSFIGAHFDVVPATAADWTRDPFKLTRENDLLYGRGVTDCLGHVALIAVLIKQLAELNIQLSYGIGAVFIANEESHTSGVGIDKLNENKELEFCRSGPCYWIDSANSQLTIGTGGMLAWELTATGKGFHSGIPNRAINALSLGMESIRYIQHRFYNDFPHHSDDPLINSYNFEIGSSLKPTQISVPAGGLTQIPRECTIKGDIRVTPFYSLIEVQRKVFQYIRDLNEKLIPNRQLTTYGYDSFVLESDTPGNSDSLRGIIDWKFNGASACVIAFNLISVGYSAMADSIYDIKGKSTPFSLTGSLPLIADLQSEGFDVQVIGFGRMDAYHAVNEYAHLSDLIDGGKILARTLALLNNKL